MTNRKWIIYEFFKNIQNILRWSESNSPEERSKLWSARHSLWFAFVSMYGKMDGNVKPYSTDVCVPIDSLDEMISRAQEILRKWAISY